MLRPAEATILRRDLGPLVAIGDDGLIAHADPAALRALGWGPSLVGKPASAIIPGNRRQAFAESMRTLALGRWPADGIPETRTFLGEDGKERMLHSRVGVFVRPDGSRFLCATMTDAPAQASLDALTSALSAAGYKRTNFG